MKIPVKMRQFVLSLGVLGLAVIGALVLTFLRPAVKRTEPSDSSILVEVMVAESSAEQVMITAFGSVQEHRELQVTPEVGGRVIEQSKDLVVGGLVAEGELLIRIDPRDYQTAIEQEEAAVSRAEFELKLEQGRQVVAEKEWELLDPEIVSSELGRELALRKPQVQEKEESLEAAKSRLDKARLDLERTAVRAPFNAQVLSENVEVGQVVNPQSQIATLVATDEYRIQVSVPLSRLNWIQLPRDNEEGARAWIIQDFAEGEEQRRAGQVVQLLANVDPQGRMARLQIAVKDPLNLSSGEEQRSPLLIGSYVRSEIEGPLLQDVIRLPREAIREGNRIWVKNKEDRLEIREVAIVFSYEKDVLIEDGLEPGEEVVVSPIPVPIPGMRLKAVGERLL